MFQKQPTEYTGWKYGHQNIFKYSLIGYMAKHVCPVLRDHVQRNVLLIVLTSPFMYHFQLQMPKIVIMVLRCNTVHDKIKSFEFFRRSTVGSLWVLDLSFTYCSVQALHTILFWNRLWWIYKIYMCSILHEIELQLRQSFCSVFHSV